MKTRKLLQLIILGLMATSAHAADSSGIWTGYVCKVMDFPECEKGKKRIYPIQDVYQDKETCIKEFGKMIEDDSEMSKKYPQVDDIKKSYIYDCEKKSDKSI